MFKETDRQTKMFFKDIDIADEKMEKIKNSWACFFYESILPILMRLEQSFKKLYRHNFGRPNWPVAVLLGILILKHEMDLTDEMTVEQFNFNILWHKALGVRSCDANICRKTIHNFQKRMQASMTHVDLFNEVTKETIAKAGIKINKQRLDSVHIHSNMAHLGRVRLFNRTMEIFLKQVKKKLPDRFGCIPQEILDRYLKREGYFSDPKPSEAQKKSLEIAVDIHMIVEGFAADEAVVKLKGYRLLKRLLSEQCKVGDNKVSLEKPPSTSLQNPSDPDATYSGHKGQGYQAQVTETCTGENPFNVVTSIHVEGAHESDSKAVEEVIDRLEEQGLKPDQMTADTGYGSQKNVDHASECSVDLVSPVPGKEPETQLDECRFDGQTGEMTHCPAGKPPKNQRYRANRGKWKAEFDAAQCTGCANMDRCPGRSCKNGNRRFYWTDKEWRLHERRRYQKSNEFKEIYKIRSGIEATFSQLKNTHGGGRLSVRGMSMIEMVVFLKFTALNVRRWLKNVLTPKRTPQLGGQRAGISRFIIFLSTLRPELCSEA
jgi:hypothetical protein